MKKTGIEAKEAAHGERMIEVKVRFWTNDIADGIGKIIPKHAWAAGVVRMDSNKAHGITPGKPRNFHSLLEMPSVVEQVLVENGITLHRSGRMRKYIEL